MTDELAVQRMKAKLETASASVRASITDAVDAWFEYQNARVQVGEFAAEVIKEGFHLGSGETIDKIDPAAFEAFEAGLNLLLSPRFIDAMIDEILDPAIAAAEEQMIAEAEEADGVCRHQRARINDGAPEDAVVVPCAIIELFGPQTGDTVPNIACPGCGGELVFRTWRPKVTPWAVDRPADLLSMPGDNCGPWLQCSVCDKWSTTAYEQKEA